jgi:hypothetical protein
MPTSYIPGFEIETWNSPRCPNARHLHPTNEDLREQRTGNREQGTGSREQGAGNREQGLGNRD